ncbi:MAG: ATP-binding protein [Fibrobacteres bacterium]|nr:ATP-binding protein [Fibrobacterota bacterium]
MKPRSASRTLEELGKFFPIVALTGPRQVGKTTLARLQFPEKPYVSLENPDLREQAQTDPRGFLARYPDGAILDEIQRVPELFSYLQQIVDEDRTPGRFVLTGSHQFGLRSKISQSLAGRVGLVHLLPFSTSEWHGADLPKIDDLLFRGLFPPVLDREIPPHVWFPQYVATYVERDVREILSIKDLGTFSRFVRLCAARSGQLLNLSSLAADCGITHNTAKSWIDVLEASYLIVQLRPWHENFGKRLIKTPKIYLTDTGLLCWLLRIESAEHLATHAQRGAIFENWVVMESLKRARNRGAEPNLYFWRDQAGHEIDLLEVEGDHLHAIEIKSGATVPKDAFKGLAYFQELSGDRLSRTTLIHGGDGSYKQSGIDVRSWKEEAGRG